ncbi:MAG: hypothetical protein ACTSR7_18375 [Promethearchaeota archaeon]
MGEIDDSEDPIRRAFLFLKSRSRTPDAFSKEDFKNSANYPNPDNFKSYFSKKFRHLLDKAPNDRRKYLVSGVFRKYSKWEKFRAFYSQSSKIKVNYIEECYNKVMIFEFFMPLTNEYDLRSSLDELFYRDTVKLALNKIPESLKRNFFPKNNEEESDVQYNDHICNWISERFGGYSIGTVRGRFKIDDLKSYSEVAIIQQGGDDYLIDETTAIVRFIFHIGESIKNQKLFYIEQFDEIPDEDENLDEMLIEANKIRFVFKHLFIRNILELINGEDEIWMLESGIRTRLYIWKIK